MLDGNDGIVYEVTPWTPAQTITTIDTNVTQIVVAPDRTGSQVLWMLKGDGYLNELMVGDSGPRNFDTDVTQIAAAHAPQRRPEPVGPRGQRQQPARTLHGRRQRPG